MSKLAPAEHAIVVPWTVRPGQGGGAASAWFLPGADPATWLRELLLWPAALAEVWVLPLPDTEGRPAGALAVPPLGQGPREATPQARPFVRRGGKMFLPADGVLSPPCTDEEIAASAVDDHLVFLPTVGWIGADEAEWIPAVQWIAAPASTAVDWPYAVPGWAPPRRLRAVRLIPEGASPSPPPDEPERIGASEVRPDLLPFDPQPATPAFAEMEAAEAAAQRPVRSWQAFGSLLWERWNAFRLWARRRLHDFVLRLGGDRGDDAAAGRPELAGWLAEAFAWTFVLLACWWYIHLLRALWLGGLAALLPTWQMLLAVAVVLTAVALLAVGIVFASRRSGRSLFRPPPENWQPARLSSFTERAVDLVALPAVAVGAMAAAALGVGAAGFFWITSGLGGMRTWIPGGAGVDPTGGSAGGVLSGGGAAPPPAAVSGRFAGAALRWTQDALAAAFVKWMETFQSDPDRALPFAVPLGGDGPPAAQRGTQQFAWVPRDVSLRLDALLGPSNGGQGIQLPPWLLTSLSERYRAEAERLVRLKQYRRAAYVYGRLLRDFRMAADCMERDGAWREAAELHLRRLEDPAAAARCFEQAGLFRDAAELREKLAQWLAAAKLYGKIEDRAQAERCFRLAVRDFRRQGEHLAAGDVLRDHLQDFPAAREEYFKGWDQGKTACLAPWLELSAPPHHEEAALAPLERKLAELQTATPLIALVQALKAAKPAGLPDLPERLLPAVQQAVGRWLPKASGRLEAAELIDALAWSCRNDPRVGRDGRRFLDAKRPPAGSTAPRAAPFG